MPAFSALFDKRKRAIARAKFGAWWNGSEFDEAAVNAAIEAALAEEESESKDAGEQELFEEPDETNPRLLALARLWGGERIMPGDSAVEAEQVSRLGLNEQSVLYVLGPGLAAPLASASGAHPGQIVALEWRDETRESLMQGVRRAKLAGRVSMQAVDLDTYTPAVDSMEGLLSLDDFTYAANAPRLAQQITKALKPNACAIIETYCAIPAPATAPAFASSFAEPQLRPAGDLADLFTEAGLAVEANDDVTAEHQGLARAGFKRLEQIVAAAVEQQVDLHVLREVAWEAAAWKARLRLLAGKRLERRRMMVRKAAG